MEQVLFKDKVYSGQYVAINDISDPAVIAYGDDPQAIYNEAVKKGSKDPAIIFVPKENIVQIFITN